MNYILLVYPAIFIIVYFYGCTIYKKSDAVASFLSKKQTKRIQSLACTGVVLHHLTQQITGYGSINRGPITVLSSMGILFTSVFFFVSGFGLIVSLETKENYLDTFLLHRIPTILIPFFVSNVIFVIYRAAVLNRTLTFKKIISYIFGLKLINSNGWFIIEIFFLYIAFYILFRFIKNRDFALALLILFSVCLILFSKSLGRDDSISEVNSSWFMGEWWFNSTIVFPMGLLFARFRDKIYSFIRKYYMPVLIITLLSFIVSFRYEAYIRNIYGYYRNSFSIGGISPITKTLAAQIILNIISTFLIVVLSIKIETKSRVYSFMGTFTMELFLIHHLFMDLFSDSLIENMALRFLLVIVSSFTAAFLLSRFDRLILNCLFKITSKFTDKWGKKVTVNTEDITLEKSIQIQLKKKKMKRLTVLACAAILVFIVYELLSSHVLFKAKEAREEIASLKKASVGDEVLFGYFDTDVTPFKERISWIVIDKDEDTCTLLSKYGLDSGSFNKSHKEVSWEDSTLRASLHDNDYSKMFSSHELKYMIQDDLQDYISIPSVSQIENLDHDILIARCTELALKGGVNTNDLSKANHWDFVDQKASWWWLKDDNPARVSITAPIVTVDGKIEFDSKYVNKPNGAIRPVITINYLGKQP